MKKLYLYIIPLLLIFLSCSDTDKNPWLDQIELPKPIKRLTVVEDAKLGDLSNGLTVINDSTLAFVVLAPGKEEVHWIGEYTFWKAKNDFKMNKEGERFWIQIQGFEPNKEYAYQYLLDKDVKVADPYARKVTDKNDEYIPASIYPNLMPYPSGAGGEIAAVASTNTREFNWSVQDFKIENPENMVIYELLLRDFTTERSIKAAQAKLPYLKELGINVIELMPFNEFEGNESWGYNPSFFFATDKAYGTEEAYKEFIDECHKNGIAVVMDMVLNHAYGQSPFVKMYFDSKSGKVTADNPWFNVESPNSDYSWGYDFNHESKYTEQLVDDITAFWMNEFKIDGFRFDFTKGFTNTKGNGWAYDASRIKILKRMADAIRTVNKDALIIFEHLTDNKEETELADYGIYLWGNMNEAYNENTMGWNGDKGNLNWTYYKTRGWTKPTLISYMESHDEERIMFKTLKHGNSDQAASGYDVKQLETALARSGAAAMIYLSVPGPKMIWQFGELGYDYELNDDRLAPKPVRWDYYDEPARKAVFDVYASMIKLRNENPIFRTDDVTLSLDGSLYKEVVLKSSSGNVVAIANFDVVEKTKSVSFGTTGEWTDHFSKGKLNVTSAKQDVTLKAGEYRLYMK